MTRPWRSILTGFGLIALLALAPASVVTAGDPELDDLGLDELLGGEDADDEDQGKSDTLRDWKGFVELKPRLYLRDRDDDGGKNGGQFLLESEFELDLRFTETWSGHFRPRIFLDLFDGELERFEPFEAHVTYSGSGWDLRAGQFVENWGIVDTYNPIDVVNRRDLATDFLDAERLGELGLRFRGLFDGNKRFGEPTISVYALPIWQETPFLPDDQRFGFGTETTPFDQDAGFEPSGSERGFYALRFGSTFDSKPVNADIQFLVSTGPERFPLIVAGAGGASVPAYYGATTFGMGFRAVPNRDAAGQFLSTLTLKTEVVYKAPRAFDESPIDEPDDYVAYVLGVDREFYGAFRGQDTLTMTIEYAGEDGADPADDAATRFRAFGNDIIVRAFWEPNDFARSSLEARGIYDFDTDETIFELIYERQLRAIHEDLKLSAQWQRFDPPETGESLFDFFPNNSSLAVGLRWDL